MYISVSEDLKNVTQPLSFQPEQKQTTVPIPFKLANERIQQTRITHVVPEKKIQIQGADSKVTKIVQVVMPKKGLIEKRKTPIIIPNTKIHKLNKFHMTKNPNSIPEAEKAPIISNVISNEATVMK